MNKTYRLIWNHRLNAWVVASELTRASGKKSSCRTRAGVAAVVLALGTSLPLAAADLPPGALPTGGTVVAGQADIVASGTRMDITQGSQKAIINWQGFDIGSQAQVNFAQPNASAVALNRVSGPAATRIEGQLTANGQVFLINPNGVLFGNGARVNAGAFVASTLNIRDDDFLTGNYTFTGTGGAIENQGAISAAPGGYLAFIAPKITNAGTLSAPQGTVAMGAGERVTLNFAGDRLVGLSVTAATLDTLIENRQAIRAEGGAILLTAAGAEAVTRGVINNSGVLEAGSLTADGGRIVLTAGNDINFGAGSSVAVDGQKGGEITVQAKAGTLLADGSLSARGASGTGGSVQLLGRQVGLVNAAQVDASGATGGGTVLIGGDYQGGNAAVQNAWRTYVSPAATIRADALQQGDGGKVIVWADDATRFYGKISATGGTLAGNGGFVEVSGKGYLDFNGVVDTAALNGSVGTLLLDPTNIEVVSGGTATLAQVNQFTDPDLTASCAAFGNAACSRIAPTTINAATANVVLQATNNILFTNAVSMTNPGWSLTATTQTGNITVNAPIVTANRTTSGTTGAVTLTAGGNVVLNADIATGSATVADAAGNTTAASGAITVTAVTGISGAGRLITGNATLTGAAAGTEAIRSGNITLNVTGAGAIGLGGTNALTIGSATGNGAGSTATTGNITFTSADRINNGTAGSAIDVSFGAATGGATNTVGSLTATTDGGAGASGEIVITSGEALRLGAINAGGGAITLDVGAATTSAGVISGTGTSLTKLGAGTLTLSGANTYTGATNINAGTLALGAANRIANTSAVTVASGATFNLANFAETVGSLAGAGNVTLGSATLTAGGDNTTTSFSGVVSGTGGLIKAGTGTLTLSGANTYTGTTTISAGTLVAANNTALGTTAGGTVVSGTNASLALQGGITIGAETLSLNGTGVGTNGALRNLSGNNTWGGTVTLAGTTEIQSDAGTLTLSAANSVTGTNRALTIDGAGDTAINGTITTGTGTLTKNGTGTLTLSGADTYTGATSINAGTLVAANNGALGTAAGATTVASGATLALQGGITIADALTLNGTGVGGGGALRNLNGNNTTSGAVTLGAGGARINSDAGLLTMSGAIGGATRPLTLGGAGNTTISGAIGTTSGTLTKDGSGILTLSGTNTYTGTTTISGGTLQVGNGGTTGTLGTGAVIDNAALVFNRSNILTVANVISGNGTVTQAGGGTTIFTGNNTYSGTTTISAGTLQVGNSGTSGSLGTGNVIDNGSLSFARSDTYTVANNISGTGSLTKTNLTGALTLSGNNTYTGTTFINGGSLTAAGGNALPDSSPVTLLNNASAVLNLANSETIGDLSGGGATGGNVTLGANTLTVNQSGSTVYAGLMSGTGGLTKIGAGTLQLSHANTYTGTTNIQAGTLAIGGSENIADASTVNVASGATFDLRGFNETIDALTGGGAVTKTGTGATTLTVGFNNGSGAFSGVIQNPTGTLALTKIGTGTQTLSGANTYSGATSINDGALIVANNGALGDASSGTNVGAGGTLAFDGGITVADTLAITGTGYSGGGALRNLVGNNMVTGGVTLSGSALIVTDANSTLTISGALNGAGRDLTVAGTGSFIAQNATNDVASLTATNAGSVALRDANAIALNGSTLAGNLLVQAGGALTLNGAITANGTGDTITLSGTRFVNSAGASALAAPNGRWLVWSSNANPFGGATPDVRGGLAYDFKQYNAIYGVTPVQGAGNGFLYTLAPTITPGLTGTVSKVYDTTTTATLTAANFTPTTGMDGDVIAMTGTGAYDNPNVAGSPTKLVTASGIAATVTSSIAEGSKPVYGYTLTSTTASANIGEITPAALTVTGATTSSTYTANAQTNTFGTTGLLGSDSVTGVSGLGTGTNVGTYADTLSNATGTGLSNYTISYVNGSLQITPAALTVTGATTSNTYTANAQTNTFGTTGLLGSDSVTGVSGLGTGTNVGTYADTLSNATGTGLSNYTISYVNGSLQITPAALTLNAVTGTKVYDGTVNSTGTVGITGLLGGDTVSGLSQSYQSKNVLGANGSTLQVNAGFVINDGNGGANYTVTQNTASGTITPAPLAITADDKTRPINTPNPTFTATYAGLVGGETPADLSGALQFSTPATVASPAGDYPITPFGQSSANYRITYLDGRLQVVGQPVTPPIVPPVPPVAQGDRFDPQAVAATYMDAVPMVGQVPAVLYVSDQDDPSSLPDAARIRVVGGGLNVSR
ncbi:autotransporter-associated beta strand repeat-containing protein [Dechloromonas sp. H13]|uniref:autotransporter-associated beta strand repeat-containing protein n=1 Tax=Dechloromonas sp. H13 TaxID=2570193 RepID=UPI0018859E3C|nr:autotransporter-associated beta strand repeat-containing protein [Dechloromonas sp. H13]